MAGSAAFKLPGNVQVRRRTARTQEKSDDAGSSRVNKRNGSDKDGQGGKNAAQSKSSMRNSREPEEFSFSDVEDSDFEEDLTGNMEMMNQSNENSGTAAGNTRKRKSAAEVLRASKTARARKNHSDNDDKDDEGGDVKPSKQQRQKQQKPKPKQKPKYPKGIAFAVDEAMLESDGPKLGQWVHEALGTIMENELKALEDVYKGEFSGVLDECKFQKQLIGRAFTIKMLQPTLPFTSGQDHGNILQFTHRCIIERAQLTSLGELFPIFLYAVRQSSEKVLQRVKKELTGKNGAVLDDQIEQPKPKPNPKNQQYRQREAELKALVEEYKRELEEWKHVEENRCQQKEGSVKTEPATSQDGQGATVPNDDAKDTAIVSDNASNSSKTEDPHMLKRESSELDNAFRSTLDKTVAQLQVLNARLRGVKALALAGKQTSTKLAQRVDMGAFEAYEDRSKPNKLIKALVSDYQ